MKNKCIFATGPESSGSMLVAKICSHVLNVQEYGAWDGVGWSTSDHHKVLHRSLPYAIPPVFPNVDEWIAENRDDYDIFFILTTRDITISELSRVDRFPKTLEEVERDTVKAKEIMREVIHSGYRYFIWSYETFMFFGKEYLDMLYAFLEVESDFIPPLSDGNRKRIDKIRTKAKSKLFSGIGKSLRFGK